MARKRTVTATMVGLILVGGFACGGGTQLTPGAMPAGGTFYGVWQSPQYGNMHLCQSGNQIIGDYAKHERSGRIQGTIDGDLMRFQWEDTRELVRGKPELKRGHGTFRLAIGEDGDQYLTGEWGFEDEDSGGGPWNAVKLRRGTPDRCTGEQEQEAPEEERHEWDDEDVHVSVWK